MSDKWENPMNTPEFIALHCVECYALLYPGSGARQAAEKLKEKLLGMTIICNPPKAHTPQEWIDGTCDCMGHHPPHAGG